jgi:hypothetical protein
MERDSTPTPPPNIADTSHAAWGVSGLLYSTHDAMRHMRLRYIH